MRDWTQAGRNRQMELVESLKQKLSSYPAQMQEARGGNNTGNSCETEALVSIRVDKATVQRHLLDAENLLAEIRVVSPPRQTDRGQVGLEAQIEYLDDYSSHKRGKEESFIIGGQGESDDDEVLRTISCVSPLGRAIVNARIGDERTVVTPNGDTYDIKIRAFSIPEQKAPGKKAA